ncbi:MAG: sigma-54 dependent transcriptional regulator, partial [Candidatus Latescibacterota bacterium]
LLTGPSGTGKELAARAIHAKSSRAGGEFIAVNCGAIPRELIESELFGHVKGAFTGAIREKKGTFELADGGTILLDEVSELAVDLQVRLLRVLQERVIEPVGTETVKHVDVRIIGSSNADLQLRVSEGQFREDLFFRLNVIPIRIPSLVERLDDIPLLVKEFVRRYSPHKDISVSPEMMDHLRAHSWPGNIRELENLVERMVILRKADVLIIADLPDDFGQMMTAPARVAAKELPRHLSFHEAEEKLIREALNRCGWNRTKAAKHLEIPRHVLLYRMKKYNITKPDTRKD